MLDEGNEVQTVERVDKKGTTTPHCTSLSVSLTTHRKAVLLAPRLGCSSHFVTSSLTSVC